MQVAIATLAAPVESDKALVAEWMSISLLFRDACRPLLYREICLVDETAVSRFWKSISARSQNGALVRSLYLAVDAEDFAGDETAEELFSIVRNLTGLVWFRAWFDPLSSCSLEFWSERASVFSPSVQVFRLSNSDPVSQAY